MTTIQIPYKFIPRNYQLELLCALDSGYKRAIAVYHRRAGKDKTLFNLMVKKSLERVGTYFYFFPEFAQGRRVIWDGMDGSGMPFRDHIPKQLIERANSTDMKMVLTNGSVLQIIGTDKFDKVRGANPVGCVFSEQAYQNPAAWDVVRPILLENGGWAVFNSTPNGKNHFHKMYQKALTNDAWFTQNITIDDSRDGEGNMVITPEMIEEERLSGMSEEIIQQEYYNSFTSNSEGFYYLSYLSDAEEDGRIGNVPYDPTIPVDTWWDIGVGDSTAIWFTQIVKKEIHVIDFYKSDSVGLEHYAKYLQGLPYIYGTHNFPHDMINTEFGTGRTRLEVAEELFKSSAKLNMVQKVGLEDGINAARMIIPRCWFDEKRCHKGLDALFNYHRQWDDKCKEYKNKPAHDWASHPADAFRYFAVGLTMPKVRSNKHDFLNRYKRLSARGWQVA